MKLEYNFVNEKYLLISSSNMSHNVCHYKKYTASWYRKYIAVWCKALAIVIRLQWNINFQVRFSENPQKFRDTFFVAEGQTERGMGMMSLTVAFRNFGRLLHTWHIYRWPVKYLEFLQPQYLISPHYLSGHNSYTHHPSTDLNAFNSQSPVFLYDA